MNLKINQKLDKAFKFKNDKQIFEFEADKMQIDFLHEIKKVLDEKDISSTDLAEKFGTSKAFISQLFSCDKRMNLIHLAKLQKFLDLKVKIDFIDSTKKAAKEIPTEIFEQKIHICERTIWKSYQHKAYSEKSYVPKHPRGKKDPINHLKVS